MKRFYVELDTDLEDDEILEYLEDIFHQSELVSIWWVRDIKAFIFDTSRADTRALEEELEDTFSVIEISVMYDI